MRFGAVGLDQAMGAVLAHSVPLGRGRLRKGVVLGAAEIGLLREAGLQEVVVARLDPQDVAEDEAAARLGAAMVPEGADLGLELTPAFTGRVNLHATVAGVLELDAGAIHALNAVDPAITCATLAPFARVQPGMLVGTLKIIPYAVPGEALARACAVVGGAMVGGAVVGGAVLGGAASGGPVRVRPVVVRTAGLVLTEVAGQDAKLARKGARAIKDRLGALGIDLARVEVVSHTEAAIAAALATMPQDLLLILTGSATSDANDTAPAALRLAGGRVDRFGMPVDPGNLLFLGALGGRPVIGLPGCARSPALNGADWVLERVACGIAVTSEDIARMGVGGLLMEITTRPQPREPEAGGAQPH